MKRLSLIYSLVATILFCGANHLYAGDVWPDGTPLDPWFHKAASRHTPSQYFDITRYGATPDSTRIQTDAIQKAIDEAARNGGTVLVPEGCFVTGALFFKPGTSLHLAKGAVLKGSRDIKDYPDAPVHIEGVVQPYVSAIVNAYNVDGFSISGAGTIDGDGLVWWKAFWDRHKQNPKCTNLEVRRPRMVYICGSNDVSIDGVSFVNSGFWTLHLYKCDKVSICSARISAPMRTPMRAPSTDGVDIDACNNVHIKDCFITSGDDMISIKGGKGPWADTDPGNGTNSCILVENCHFGLGPAVIAVGSECVVVDKLILRNSEVDDADRLLWLKMRPDTPQKYSNIRVDNVSGQAGRVLYIKPWTQFFDLKGRTDLPVSIVDGVEITNCNINCRKERSVVEDAKQYRLENIIMSNNHFGPYDDALAPAFAGKGSVSWEAKWIGVQKHRGPIDLRTTINITGKVKRATAYVSAKGIYQAYVDGRKIGDDLLTLVGLRTTRGYSTRLMTLLPCLGVERAPLPPLSLRDGTAAVSTGGLKRSVTVMATILPSSCRWRFCMQTAARHFSVRMTVGSVRPAGLPSLPFMTDRLQISQNNPCGPGWNMSSRQGMSPLCLCATSRCGVCQL